MTTKQAALLAAVGTAVQIVTPATSTVSAILRYGAWYNLSLVLNLLFMLLQFVLLLGPLLAFFVCVYLDEPPLAIPERLRRPAWVVAIAAGLSAAYAAFSAIREFIGSLDIAGVSLVRASHPFYWSWQWLLNPLIWILAAVGVPLFFFAVARSTAEPQGVSPRLKKAAKYAGIFAIVGAIYAICVLTITEISYSEHQASLAARGITSGARMWSAIEHTILSLFHNGSLAWFFYQFVKTVPTAQSSQRVSSGE